MIQVSDIWADAQEAFGRTNDLELYQKIEDAVELLANKGDWDPLRGFADMCVTGSVITLPREVEVPLAINMGGRPTIGRDQLFSFHLNGMGDCRTPLDWEWRDSGDVVTLREMATPSRIVAFLDDARDAGKEIIVYGHDDQQRWIVREENGQTLDGYRVPTIYGYALPDANAPKFSRITRIRKAVFLGGCRLQSFEASSTTGTLIGVYEPGETDPTYRQIKLSRPCNFIRICYRRRILKLRFQTDHLPLHSRLAIVLAMKAVSYYLKDNVSFGNEYEANATRLLEEEEKTHRAPTMSPMQIDPSSGINMRDDDFIQ